MQTNENGTIPATPPPPASILVVDDRPANLVAIEAVLSPLGIRIV
jgi:CheY-like chemotaxis protein